MENVTATPATVMLPPPPAVLTVVQTYDPLTHGTMSECSDVLKVGSATLYQAVRADGLMAAHSYRKPGQTRGKSSRLYAIDRVKAALENYRNHQGTSAYPDCFDSAVYAEMDDVAGVLGCAAPMAGAILRMFGVSPAACYRPGTKGKPRNLYLRKHLEMVTTVVSKGSEYITEEIAKG